MPASAHTAKVTRGMWQPKVYNGEPLGLADLNEALNWHQGTKYIACIWVTVS